MEDLGGEVAYPSLQQVCEVNRRMVEEFGGFFLPPDNLRNQAALEYVLDAVQSSVYGSTLYPTLKEKAAAITHHIISRHVFYDGNKRTAAHIAWEFLRSNGVLLYLDATIIDLTASVAGSQSVQKDVLLWLHGHQEH